MIKYEVKTDKGVVLVSINVNSPNEAGTIIYEGGGNIDNVRNLLEDSCGAFGHLIGDTTSPIDLDCALQTQKKFPVKLIEGGELVKRYDPEIPKGALT